MGIGGHSGCTWGTWLGHGCVVPCAGYAAVYERFSGVFSTDILKSEQERVCVSHSVSMQRVDAWEPGEKVGT